MFTCVFLSALIRLKEYPKTTLTATFHLLYLEHYTLTGDKMNFKLWSAEKMGSPEIKNYQS